MSAIVRTSGAPRQLDLPASPDETVAEEEVTRPPMLVRRLEGILRDIAGITRRYRPERVDFEDFTVDATGTTANRFPHGLRGRVRWWVVDWIPASAGTRPNLWRDDATREGVLVLLSGAEGVLTLRVEEAG